jgi:hypothetical protein
MARPSGKIGGSRGRNADWARTGTHGRPAGRIEQSRLTPHTSRRTRGQGRNGDLVGAPPIPRALVAASVAILVVLGSAVASASASSDRLSATSPPVAVRYVVRTGDTITAIVRAHLGHVDLDVVDDIDAARNGAPLMPGEVLWLPQRW